MRRKGFAISMAVIALIAIVTLVGVWYSGQTLADTVLGEAKDTVLGMMGKKKVTIRNKETFIGILKCYTALKMRGHGIKIKELSFPRLKGTRWEGCVAMGSGPRTIDFELDLEEGDYIELGTEEDNEKGEIGEISLEGIDKSIHVFGPDGRGDDETGPQGFFNVNAADIYSICAPLELAIANGDTRGSTSRDKGYKFCQFGRELLGEKKERIKENKVRIWDEAKGYIKGQYTCKIGGAFDFPWTDFLEKCHGTLNIIIEDKGKGDYETQGDALIEAMTGIPEGKVRVTKPRNEEEEEN
mgnify:CR=1 FL=1